ncbi:hypothetical protein ACEN2I_14410 [Flavobacterium sp. W22_SRS_FK3]|uniref:hypothetical protein n=1 Tax=Flavobacterium sp. W22_SRS_FK3 TaxID=3240275 RepID=UPI003F92520E
MKIKLIKVLLIGILYYPIFGIAQISSKVAKSYPAHIVYKLDELNSKVKLSEDKQIKIGHKLYTADSLANISLVKGEPVTQLKSYYIIDANFLKSILSPEELDRYGYMTDRDNRFLAVLIFSTHLKLEPTQISEIRRLNDSVASVPKMSSKETIRIYNKKLQRILNKEQYIAMLKTIYHEQAEEDAQKDWSKIIKLQLVADKNDKSQYVKILNYHIAKNAFLDKKADRYDKTKRDFLAKKMALGEPPLLVHANILSEGTYTTNKYSSIIKYEKELELTKSQIDTLLLKYNQLQRIKLENKEKESTAEAPKTVPSEYENIAQILNPEQVKKWLIQKNKQAAKKEAQKNWEQLEAEGLTKDLDKDKTLTEFAVYQLQFLVTKDRAMVYHTQENIFMKRDIEKKKPELLKQLDIINQKKSQNAKTKQALTW